MVEAAEEQPFNILSLDGGGSKGVYSLGVLNEVEKLLDNPLHEHFDLVYGTSTGAIIAALVALGNTVSDISKLYFEIIPAVMKSNSRKGRSRALAEETERVFGEQKFDAFKTGVGIVATHYEYKRPMIFKSSVQQAHGRTATFEPGFGCTIADALVASTAAFPYFDRAFILTANQGEPELLDGGYVANNPTLFAIADATQALSIDPSRLRVLSVGVGNYPAEKRHWVADWLWNLWPFQLIETTFSANTNTLEQIRSLLFADIRAVRIDDSFTDGKYATSLLESDVRKLKKIQDLGRESFGRQEDEVRELLGLR